MKKVGFSLVLCALIALAFSLVAKAVIPVTPTVTAIEPASAFNDIGTRVTITGADFTAETTVDVEASPTVVTTTTPAVRLGTTPLTDVTWVDTQTLTAIVPWGMDPGVYALTVVNPGGGIAELPGAFEVRSGINTWNAGELNGASVRELVMKPGDPNTLYALAYDVGVFRSRDAGASWTFTSASVIGNAVFTVDRFPGHESWLYSAMNNGVFVSRDEGDTWTQLPDPEYDNVVRMAQVFPSPNTSGTLFVTYYGDTTPVSLLGLRTSTDGGATWSSVAKFNGMPVQSIAFDPTPGSHGMVLATTDARVFASSDEGVTWDEVLRPPLPLGIGMNGYITYNPYRAGEVWISSFESSGGTYKTSLPSPTAWTDVSGGLMGFRVTFAGPDDVYNWHGQSHDGGRTWTAFGPWPTWGDGVVLFGRDAGGNVDLRTVYVTNAQTGIQCSTDGGGHWSARNEGLAGMRCTAMSVSKADPLRVYATFDGWGGVYVSDDGTSHWTYTPVEGSGQAWSVLEDLFDPQRVYLSTDGGFFWSTNAGASWNGGSWSGVSDSERGLMTSLVEDPFAAPGHLLVASRRGQTSTHDTDLGFLFSSDDFGASWQRVAISASETSMGPIWSIVFDPSAPGTVYISTGGNGVWRSEDHGRSGTWTRIDDRSQPWMANDYALSIATHPQHVLLLSGDSGRPYYSFDDGVTWKLKAGSGETSARTYVFVDGDSTRLYSPDWTGLHFSSNVGDSWTDAAGVLGSVQNTALAYAYMDGHTLLYAATTGGKTGVVIARPSVAGASLTSRAAVAAEPNGTLVDAGIYRRAQVSVTATFTSTGWRDGWVLESGEYTSRGGSTSSGSTTLRLGDNATRRQYRSILSFTTGATLPDNAVITRVALRIRRQGVTGGGDPVAKFRGFMADIKRGYFGTGTSLRASDFQASASKSVGSFKPALTGGWYTLDLGGAKAYVNRTSSGSGLTQVRLRFRDGDNNNRIANYLRLYSGDAASGYRPQLVVTYYVP